MGHWEILPSLLHDMMIRFLSFMWLGTILVFMHKCLKFHLLLVFQYLDVILITKFNDITGFCSPFRTGDRKTVSSCEYCWKLANKAQNHNVWDFSCRGATLNNIQKATKARIKIPPGREVRSGVSLGNTWFLALISVCKWVRLAYLYC